LCLSPALPANENAKEEADTIRIGLVSSLFRDLPGSMTSLLLKPFGNLMRAQTGMNGKLIAAGSALSLGRDLNEDKVHLGVFHGVEFAWAQERYPKLKPLVLAVNHTQHLRALLVTRGDSPAADLADLRGKKLALAQRTKEHCHIYLGHHCRALGAEPDAFFAKIVRHANVEDALDDVVRGKVDAAVVDGVALKCYEHIKPGCHARLKVLQKSPAFPAAVVAYHEGRLDEATLARFRDGMLNAGKDTRSRELMNLWKLTSFEAIPADYQRNLIEIRRAYPAPHGP
jgi:ABC-type phosphate/phosphonate transport system substrate-binding protein